MPEIDDRDVYADSDTILAIVRKQAIVARFRAVIHDASNVGMHVRLPGGRGLLAVKRLEDDTYIAELPDEL